LYRPDIFIRADYFQQISGIAFFTTKQAYLKFWMFVISILSLHAAYLPLSVRIANRLAAP